jgi:hypothetical protein
MNRTSYNHLPKGYTFVVEEYNDPVSGNEFVRFALRAGEFTVMYSTWLKSHLPIPISTPPPDDRSQDYALLAGKNLGDCFRCAAADPDNPCTRHTHSAPED